MERMSIPLKRSGPERLIQDALVAFLKARDWAVTETHGSVYQMGLPDLYCMHAHYGERWVEVKNPVKFAFTAAQKQWFPLYASKGARIYVMTAASEEQYKWLTHGKPNWHQYML